MTRPWETLQTPWPRRLWLDALSLFSPRRAAVAWHMDRMERDPDYRESVHLGMRLRGYASAKSGDNTTPWSSSIGARSADAEVLADLEVLRDRARIIERDDPVGSGLVLQFTQQMVGTGIADRAATGDEAKDLAINEEWEALRKNLAPAEGVSWEALQRMLADRMNADGEIFVKRSKTKAAEPLFFEIVEGDRVDTPSDVRAHIPEGSEVRKGVERDAAGKITHYWMAKNHPGDVAIPTLYANNLRRILALSVRDYERVSIEDAKHLHRPGRPGQSRFVTMLHAVTQNLRDLDLLLEATTKRIQIAACLAVFIETSESIPDLIDVTAKKYHYQLDQDLVPGMIFVLRPGETMSTVNPDFPIPDVEQLVKILARRIGAALGVSWRVVLADLGDANFSAARADRIEFEQSATVPRQSLVEVLAWMRQNVLEDSLLRGSERLVAAGVEVEELAKAAWYPPRKPYLEPKKEAEAAKLMLEGEAGKRLMSRRQFYAERQLDWKAELRQQLLEDKAEAEMRAELGMDAAATEDTPDEQPEADPGDQRSASRRRPPTPRRNRRPARRLVGAA